MDLYLQKLTNIVKYCTVGCPIFYTLHTLHDLLVSFLISVWVIEFSNRGDEEAKLSLLCSVFSAPVLI